VGVVQIKEKFHLHWIVTKFGVPARMKEIKSSKFQLDRDAAWSTGRFKISYCTFHHPISTKMTSQKANFGKSYFQSEFEKM
jgi:hypothetical protein